MILVFALVGTFTATLAGVTTILMGQSWWMAVINYIGTGMFTVAALAALSTLWLGRRAADSDALLFDGNHRLVDH